MWLSMNEAAELEGCSVRTIRRRIGKGQCSFREVKSRGGFKYEVHFNSLSPEAQASYVLSILHAVLISVMLVSRR